MDTFFQLVGGITVIVFLMRFVMWFTSTDFGFYLIMSIIAMYFVWIIWVGFIKKK